MSTPQSRSAVKFDRFADAARKRKIEALCNPRPTTTRHIDFAHLTQAIGALLPRVDASKGGRPPYPADVMVRCGQIIDATLVPALIPHFSKKDKEPLDQDRLPSERSMAKPSQNNTSANVYADRDYPTARQSLSACQNGRNKRIAKTRARVGAFHETRPSKIGYVCKWQMREKWDGNGTERGGRRANTGRMCSKKSASTEMTTRLSRGSAKNSGF